MSESDQKFYLELIKNFRLNKDDLIYPIFITEMAKYHQLVSMPGIFQIPYHKIIDSVGDVVDKGIKSIILFGIPRNKTRDGFFAFSANGVVQKTVRTLKSNFGDKLKLITDICLCNYNESGHCGITSKNNEIKNDQTVDYLAKIALSHSIAGADIVAPSSMMDGQVRCIREKLDNEGYKKTQILSFSAKQSSSLYKPFQSGVFLNFQKCLDKSSYQVSYCNTMEVLREIEFDIREGADMIMLKPSISSLDLIYQVSKKYTAPTVVQIVSGEYSMIKAASKMGVIDEIHFLLNLLGSLKRSGADKIITYSSLYLSELMSN